MANLSVNEATLNKYFAILESLDKPSKKRLIVKLNKSLNSSVKKEEKITNIYGAWKDSRDAEEIISEIENARYNDRNIDEL